MNKTRFLEFVHDYILKMFTGSEIIGEEESDSRAEENYFRMESSGDGRKSRSNRDV